MCRRGLVLDAEQVVQVFTEPLVVLSAHPQLPLDFVLP